MQQSFKSKLQQGLYPESLRNRIRDNLHILYTFKGSALKTAYLLVRVKEKVKNINVRLN